MQSYSGVRAHFSGWAEFTVFPIKVFQTILHMKPGKYQIDPRGTMKDGIWNFNDNPANSY